MSSCDFIEVEEVGREIKLTRWPGRKVDNDSKDAVHLMKMKAEAKHWVF